ncbi:MAG: ATP synthase subunit I [Rhodocyclaceae bacterium]|nr:ATP synthase subunit I [Rhodocyclaceae bacterium]
MNRQLTYHLNHFNVRDLCGSAKCKPAGSASTTIRKKLRWKGFRGMFKTLLLQAAAILAVAAVAGLLAGSGGARSAGLSALAGGAAYFLPNLLFVLRLRLSIATRQAGAAGFLIGEAVKLSAVIALLLFLPRLIDVNWPALIAGLFAVLFVNLFALLLKT